MPHPKSKTSLETVKDVLSLSGLLMQTILQDWPENGRQALQATREKDPALYIKLVFSLLPTPTSKPQEQPPGLTREQRDAIATAVLQTLK